MKVRVKAEFKDKHTGEIHKIGKELELSVQRINEIIQVGNLIELVEQTEQPEQSETKEEWFMYIQHRMGWTGIFRCQK